MSTTPSHQAGPSPLAALNSATLGATFPEITLADGSVVQTGTVGALLINIRAYNAAHAAEDGAKKAQLEESFRASLPLLHRVGLFGLFPPEDWVRGDNEGRRAVGRAYAEFLKAQAQDS
ncbi:hypothetical protein F4775DRAFT_592985 [Biscogniauxia sp. FL1348]|nr:hypothetical protein F4775DRAFT_592985 [Biscogniauxia sp. FL1348]